MVKINYSRKNESVKNTIEAIKRFREGNTLKGLPVKEMIEEERR